MPCSSSQGMGDYHGRDSRDEATEAMLCAVLRWMDKRVPGGVDAILSECDWQDAGVREWDAKRWWEQHKARDAARRQQGR